MKVIDTFCGLQLSYEDLDGEGYLLDFGANGAEIVVRSASPIPRQRYTIAHELGHWFLRDSGLSNGLHVANQPHSAVEKWCDQFAASLLMPRDWVVGDLRGAGVLRMPDAILNFPAGRYSVSDQAFRVRISEVSAVSIYDIQDENGAIAPVHGFESPMIEPARAAAALEELRYWLREPNSARGSEVRLHPALGLQSITRRLRGIPGRSRWLSCLLRAFPATAG